MSLLTAVNS